MEGGVKMLALERSSVKGEKLFVGLTRRNFVLAFIALITH